MDKKKVAIIYMGQAREPDLSSIYRGNLPAHSVNKGSDLWHVNWFFFHDVYDAYLQLGVSAVMDIITAHEVLVFPNWYLPNDEYARDAVISFMGLIRKTDVKVIHDVDGDYRDIFEGDLISFAKMSDVITTASSYVHKIMHRAVSKPTFTLPSCIDPELWNNDVIPPAIAREDGKLTVGLFGSSADYENWQVLAEPIEKFAIELPEVEFWVMGFEPDYLKGMSNVVFVPNVPYTEYSRVVRGCDVVLHPLNDDDSNLDEQDVHVVESMGGLRKNGYGGAVVVSSHPAYQNLSECLHVPEHTSKAWYKSIRQVLTDRTLRGILQKGAYKWVWTHRDASEKWNVWTKMYTKLAMENKTK